jgi:hypothetical protein
MPIISNMRSFKISALPLTLATLMTSTLMYGAAPYTVASAEGGPVKDALGEIVSISEAPLNNSLSYEAVVINTSDALHGSLWQLNGDDLASVMDAFPIGSKTVTVKFTLTNRTAVPVDIYGLFIKGWYENSEWLASPVTPTSKAKHVELGYPEYLVDYFGLDSDKWMIPPHKSINFAETFYVDNEDEPLTLEIIIPKKGEDKNFTVSASFQLYS